MLITSNLRVKMAEYNYSIKDVHEQTHLSRTTISNLYNGYSDGIKFYTLEKLCDLF
ncbi:TPA: helix-turn-helix transcriptional regulator, partial [Staphylococcus pseudintermedius]|nr:helix-turn-helix transcriptional regulator [Staphylococcus pseudintermedius]